MSILIACFRGVGKPIVYTSIRVRQNWLLCNF